MRPKRRILLMDANADRAGVRRLMLQTNGYYVISAETADQAIELAAAAYPDVSLIALSGEDQGVERLIYRLHRVTGRPVFVISQEKRSWQAEQAEWPRTGCFADGIFYANTPAAEQLERIRVICAHKRGPKPGLRKPPVSVGVDEAAARRIA